MASSDDLRNRLDQESAENEEKRNKIQAAIDARAHAEEFQNDSEEANRAADEAESAIDEDEG